MKLFKKFTSRMNFRSKIVVSYSLLIFLAVFIIGIYSYYTSIYIWKTKEKQSMNDVLNLVATDIHGNVSSCNSMITNFISDRRMFNTVVNGYDKDRDGFKWNDMDNIFLPGIQSILDTYSYINKFTLYTDLDVPEISDNLLHADSVKNENWYKKASESFNLYWETDGDTICISCPMQDIWRVKISDSIGVLHLELDTKRFFKNTTVDKNSKYIILVSDANGNYVWTNSDFDKIPSFADENTTHDGKRYISQTVHIDENGWDISIFLAEKALTDGAGSILRITLAICLLCLVLLVVINYFLSGKTSRRINKLYADLQEIRGGNTDITISSTDTDEIGYIINCFGETLTQLKEALDSIYEKEILEHTNRLKVLQAQINPHFLYNILSTLSFQALAVNNDEMAQTISKLSTFYRTGLNRGNIYATFEQELENVKSYVNMQLIMHNYSFDVLYSTDNRINNFRCINFIIQPVVENAITHGTDNLEQGRGIVEIDARLTSDNNIKITVSNNGPEPEIEDLNSILSNINAGYGMRNVNERIKLAYGDDYGIHFKRENGKTVVEMSFPVSDNDEI